MVGGQVDTNEINYNQTSLPDVEGSYLVAADAYDELDIPRESSKEGAAEVPEEARAWSYLDGNYEVVEQGDGDD